MPLALSSSFLLLELFRNSLKAVGLFPTMGVEGLEALLDAVVDAFFALESSHSSVCNSGQMEICSSETEP